MTPITLELTAEFDSVTQARHFARANLRTMGVGPAIAADLELVVSELVTNAVEHGAEGPVVLMLDCSNGVATVTVRSRGPAQAVGPSATWTIAEANSITGRGLGIVRRLADDVEVSRTDRTMTVRVSKFI